jgi:hypothetical protein
MPDPPIPMKWIEGVGWPVERSPIMRVRIESSIRAGEGTDVARDVRFGDGEARGVAFAAAAVVTVRVYRSAATPWNRSIEAASRRPTPATTPLQSSP